MFLMALPMARQLCDAACANPAVVEHTAHHHHSAAVYQPSSEAATLDQLPRACVVLDAFVTDFVELGDLGGNFCNARRVTREA